ncbi:ComEC/Rec2 family competence protein [Flavobacterium sp.]|uniref:ComEC/Rec2 family competence protein n=1 Tax=Flavobacterium sp. TaxID=239 RepID=UPI00286F942E|nr:ComEC/Rec2 family competence protein [Flavobacterium sp.]
MKVLQFPLARVTLVFIIGIVFAYYFQPSPNLVFTYLFVTTSLLGGVYYWSTKRANLVRVFGISVYITAFGIGMSSQTIHTATYQKNHFSQVDAVFEQTHTFNLVLREKLKSSTSSQRYIALVQQIDTTNCSGKILLNIKKDSLHHSFIIGNRLQIQGNLYPNVTPKNPNQFDYGSYLKNKQIYGQLYADGSDIKISTQIEKDIWYYAAQIRNTIITNLTKDGFNSTELNVAVALILGQQQDIDPEISKDYQYAGAVHILSVSGLHIGFLLLFVTFILKPVPNNKKGSLLKLIVILCSLWLFGILAGLAPSVVRSVTMFSFVAIGQHLRRSVNIYHTLLVSILLILLVQPGFLFDVGFQLSYLALFFILWFHPLLSQIWTPKNKISKYIWDILSVSFAAQIGTLPLSLYYFHQFPGLFFITNLVIIPLTGFIMGLGVVVMVLAFINQCPFFLSKGLEWSLFIVNKIIHTIASLEQFIIKDIPFTLAFLLTSYAVVFSTILWFKKPRFTRLVTILVSVILVQIAFLWNKWSIENQHEWVVFNSKKNTLIVERKGDDVTLFANDNLSKIGSKNNTINSYLVGNFSHLAAAKELKNTVFFNGKRILILDSLGVYPIHSRPDIVLLTQSPKINLERLIQTTQPKAIVADASNYKNLQKLWEATCLKEKIPFHSTSEKGFYILN